MTARITPNEIKSLPRWARLAFASRCLQRARRLASAQASQASILDLALSRLEEACRSGQAGDDLADAAASAYTLALDNLDSHAAGADHEREVATCMVAHAIAFAAEAAILPDSRQATHLLAQSIDFAIHAVRLANPAEA